MRDWRSLIVSAVVIFDRFYRKERYDRLEDGIDFGAARGEVGGKESYENEQEFGDGEIVVVVVEEDADRDMQQYAHNDTHDEALQQFVGWEEVEVEKRAERCHDGEEQEQGE